MQHSTTMASTILWRRTGELKCKKPKYAISCRVVSSRVMVVLQCLIVVIVIVVSSYHQAQTTKTIHGKRRHTVHTTPTHRPQHHIDTSESGDRQRCGVISSYLPPSQLLWCNVVVSFQVLTPVRCGVAVSSHV